MFLKLPRSITSQRLGSLDLRRFGINVLNKGKSALSFLYQPCDFSGFYRNSYVIIMSYIIFPGFGNYIFHWSRGCKNQILYRSHTLAYIMTQWGLPSASDKANLFAGNLSKNSDLDDYLIFLPGFPSRNCIIFL